jgi:hypothetical protein
MVRPALGRARLSRRIIGALISEDVFVCFIQMLRASGGGGGAKVSGGAKGQFLNFCVHACLRGWELRWQRAREGAWAWRSNSSSVLAAFAFSASGWPRH